MHQHLVALLLAVLLTGCFTPEEKARHELEEALDYSFIGHVTTSVDSLLYKASNDSLFIYIGTLSYDQAPPKRIELVYQLNKNHKTLCAYREIILPPVFRGDPPPKPEDYTMVKNAEESALSLKWMGEDVYKQGIMVGLSAILYSKLNNGDLQVITSK